MDCQNNSWYETLIPVAPVAEPDGFDARCRRAGARWQRATQGANRPSPFWTAFVDDLANGFGHRCAYSALWIANGGTVDHFLSVKSRPDLTYEWSNYRFAAHELNACKKNADAAVLDPYEVGAGWFEIRLPSLQLLATDLVPKALRAKAEYTLVRLGLRDGERVLRARRRWLELYEKGELTFEGLLRCAPLIAQAVRVQKATASAKRLDLKRNQKP